MEKICRKCSSETSSRAIFNFDKWLEIYPMYSRNLFQNRWFKEHYQKSSKNVTLVLFPSPVSFYGNSYKNQKGPGTSY